MSRGLQDRYAISEFIIHNVRSMFCILMKPYCTTCLSCHHDFVVRYCECPEDMPYLEEHEDPGHGTVCRKIKGDRSRYACPTGCSPLGQPPWCKEMQSHRPCRGVSKGNVTIIMIFNFT